MQFQGRSPDRPFFISVKHFIRCARIRDRMKHRTKLIICSLAAVLTASGWMTNHAQAADPTASAPTSARWPQRLATELHLTADQRLQIRAALAGERATWAPLLVAAQEARKNLRSAIRAGDATESSVRAASAQVAAAAADLAVERMRLYGKIAPILTDAQRRQLADRQLRADGAMDRLIERLGAPADE
jgi:Spy/CpxP family protein refolding chaperone